MKKQKGINIVEFAIVSLLFFTLLFSIIEFSRFMFIINTLGEASRRGARIAAVCPINTATRTQIQNVIRFSSTPASVTTGNILNINNSDITISYLQADFTPVSPLSDPATDPQYNTVAFVQVSINIGIQTLAIPASIQTIFPPSVTTTLPRESLGRTVANNPAPGVSVPRQCF